MAYAVEFSQAASRELNKLDPQHRRRILKFLNEHVGKLDDSRSIGKSLQGSQFGELWRYSVGDHRLLCKLEDDRLLMLAFA